MIKKFILYIAAFILLVQTDVIHAQELKDTTWKLKKEKNGIMIYTRLMDGSKFKEYKSTCVIQATPEQLISILTDVEKYPEWMAFVEVAEIVEMDEEHIFYVYSEVKIPWPFDNRDEITKSVVSRDTVTNTITVDVRIIPDYMPEKEGLVRLSSGKGVWIFKPLENGKTEAYHQFGGDPEGNIPAWIVNMFLVDGPYKTMMGLQKQVAKIF